MRSLFKTLAVAAAAAVASTGVAQAANVALFTNTTYVRYSPCGGEPWWCEASNVEASLDLWSHNVDTFTGITPSAIHSAVEGKDALLIPDLSHGANLFSALTAGARTEIVDFVNDGGALVFFYAHTNSLALVNGLFGYSLATGPTAASYTLLGGTGTAFWGGDPSIPGSLSATNTLDFTTLPGGSTSIYWSGSGDAVSLIPQGAGYVIFLGWDWHNAPPVGTAAEGGWLSVLNAAVNQAVDPTKADVALLSSTTYVDYGVGSNKEGSNLQAAIIDQGHEVMPFDTITASRFAAVLAGRDVLAIPELEPLGGGGNLFAALSSGARAQIVDFVEGGGNMVVNGVYSGSGANHLTLINGLFGFTLSGIAPATPYTLDSTEAAGTPFAGGPASLVGHSWTETVSRASLPPGSRALYRNGNSVAAATIPVGCGTVTFLAWDWFNAEPEYSNDGGWNDVLNRALGQEKRAFVRKDFNGDGTSDILWRRTNGSLLVYLMQNSTKVAASGIGIAGVTTWDMAGTGDFNGDCKADILWRHNGNGLLSMWLMDGFSKVTGLPPSAPLVWQLRGIADYNEDGKSDLLWQNSSTGLVVIWQMDGFVKAGAKGVAKTLVWQIED
jgi:hypothetical protein